MNLVLCRRCGGELPATSLERGLCHPCRPVPRTGPARFSVRPSHADDGLTLYVVHDQLDRRPVVPHVRQGESYILHKGELLAFLERGRAGLWDAASPGQLRPDAVERLAEEVLDRVLELIVAARRQARR